MIDRLNRIISLVPDNSHFGKLTGILAMLYTKKYMDSFGNLQDLTNEDIIWLNSILFFNKNGVVDYKILTPIDKFDGIRIRTLGKMNDTAVVKEIYLDRFSPIDNNQLASICSNLGFSDALNFMSMNYGISSNIMLLQTA